MAYYTPKEGDKEVTLTVSETTLFDEGSFKLPLRLAYMSRTVRNMMPDDIEDLDYDVAIPVGGVPMVTAQKCFEWEAERLANPKEPRMEGQVKMYLMDEYGGISDTLETMEHERIRMGLDTLSPYDFKFFGLPPRAALASIEQRMRVNISPIINIMNGANVLAMDDLVDTGAKCIAFIIDGMTTDQIRQVLKIQ